MIKAIIFDAGGVVIDHKPLVKKISNIFHINDKEKFWHEINIQVIPLCKNQISEEEFWRRIANYTGTIMEKIPIDLWKKDYEKLTTINQDVLNTIKKLKQSYKLALISNSIQFHEKINRKRGLYKPFDVVVLSHKVGLTKDNKDIFLLATKKLKVKPNECIFIDDIKNFVDTAKSLGMKGIIFKNSKQLVSSLKNFVKF